MLIQVLSVWWRGNRSAMFTRASFSAMLRVKPVNRTERLETFWMLLFCLLWIVGPVMLGLAFKLL
jgi:hypothetical protein